MVDNSSAISSDGTLYIGMTHDLKRRVSQHKEKLIDGFAKEHDVDMLVYYERFNHVEAAITREKRLKSWKRDWKIRLIKRFNPEWEDLYYG